MHRTNSEKLKVALDEIKLVRDSLIACNIKFGSTVNLTERIWMHKLINHNKHALGIVERIMCPYKIEDV